MKNKSIFSKISSRLSWTLTGLGAALIGVVLTLGIFVLILLAAGEIRNWLEKFIAKNFISQNYAVVPLPEPFKSGGFADEGGDLTYLSFTDLFSGFGWLDKSKTTMYHDYSASAFYLPPVLEWKKTSTAGILETKPFYAYSLEGVATDFSLDGQKISLPENFNNYRVINVSAKKLSSKILVGVVSKISETHRAEIFVLSISNPRFGKPVISFNSSYPGILGFGGEDENWLTVYGAYKGVAYQVVNGQTKDLSEFFDIRMMNGGFWPAAVHGTDGWFVYNGKENSSVRLIKLFENGTGSVQGVMDLTSRSPFLEARGMRASLDEAGKLFVVVSGAFGEQYWKLEDGGFDNSKKYEIYSLNLLGNSAQTKYAAISQISHSLGDADLRWFISTNFEDWQEVKLGEMAELETEGDKLFWKILVTPSENPKYSPFLKDVRLDYRVKPAK